MNNSAQNPDNSQARRTTVLNNGQQQRTATVSEQKSNRGHPSAHNGTDIVDKTYGPYRARRCGVDGRLGTG